jgi:hypothetical protein
LFCYWRKRLQQSVPAQFALLKTVAAAAPLELILANGEQLRIWNGVDAATFQLVLDGVRCQPGHYLRMTEGYLRMEETSL